MSQNLVSLVLSNEQLAQAEQAVTTLEQALAGLVSLSIGERRRLPKMGQKSEVFCRQTLRVLAQNPHPWAIVLVHQPMYSPRQDRDNVALREQVLPVLERPVPPEQQPQERPELRGQEPERSHHR